MKNMNQDKQKQDRQYVSAGAKWVGYRPEVKVLDCTVRDGGLMNSHGFGDDVVRAVYQGCVSAGIDFMEIGYKCSKRIFARDGFGDWKFSDEESVRRIVGENNSGLKISVMADAERTDYHQDILPFNESVIDLIRVATYIHQIPTAIDMVKDARDKGYEVCVNLMAISTVPEWELDQALEQLAGSGAGGLYLVDSFGALYSEQVQYLTDKYLSFARPANMDVGIHTHNNQQLAYANTIESVIAGATMLDASMAGLGRGAGNCPMELLLGFLHNPKFSIRPVLETIRDYIEPMRHELRWGYDIPYMITGQLNRHPRAAMEFNEKKSPGGGDIIKFYDTMHEVE